MKLSKTKLALAKVINENGGWADDSAYAANDEGGIICGYSSKPNRSKPTSYFWSGGQRNAWIRGIKTPQWHQCVLSREEYYHAYPKADADGWIEWIRDELPVEKGTIIDVKYSDGDVLHKAPCGELMRDLVSVRCEPASAEAFGRGDGSFVHIVAYRLHKPDAKPQFCESVMRSIPEPESIDGLCAKVTEENKHQHVDAKPTIEQLAQDYRNKLDFAKRKQQEADDAKVAADAALGELERAGEAHGLLVSPITEKQESELVIAVQVGDEVECIKSNINPGKHMGRIGTVSSVDVDDTSTPYLVDFCGEAKIWCHEVKFIRRT